MSNLSRRFTRLQAAESTAGEPGALDSYLTAVLTLETRPDVQKDMLEDHKRTGAYYQAVMQNRRQFEGKIVLDVGTGSGILAIFAAKAGAKKVYAVEATNMARFAKELVKSNEVHPYILSLTLPAILDDLILEALLPYVPGA